MNTALRNILKKWVRPPLIPLVRWFIRYAPSPFPRRLFWKTVVGPYFQCAQYDFVASTIFGSNISGNTADLIQRYIYYFGVWEPGLTDRLRVSLGEGDVFVDVGANIGYFTLQASKLVGPAGRVIAVEASPHIFRRLTGHLRLNQAENVDAHNFAASGDFGRVKMFLASAANIGQSGIFQKDGFTYECEVEAKPLSSVIPPDVSRRVRLIKIDVEGAEWSVLSGMVPLLQEPRENLEVIVEIKPECLTEQGLRAENIIELFARHGFHPYSLHNDYSPTSYLDRREIARPARIRTPIVSQTDVLFSRKDADHL